MPKALSGASVVHAWLKRRRSAWANRLLPTTHADAWRGASHVQRGVRGFLHLDLPDVFFFILRRSRAHRGVVLSTYTLVVSWRKHWRVSVPLSPAAALSQPSSTRRIGMGVPSLGVGLFAEGSLLASKLFSMDQRIFSLWHTLLRGLGGISRLKLRYKGKSFKWHRRKGALLLRFGHSHLVALSPLPGVRWRRFGRMKIVLYGSNWWDLTDFAQTICWWRPVNVYHGRGIRLRRQTILRKSGKVSAYR